MYYAKMCVLSMGGAPVGCDPQNCEYLHQTFSEKFFGLVHNLLKALIVSQDFDWGWQGVSTQNRTGVLSVWDQYGEASAVPQGVY